MLINGGKPKSYDKARFGDHGQKWLQAIQDELNSLHESKTYELVKLCKGKKALKNIWVFKIRLDENTL